jgi:beta-aspartyl-peptidase (threonine type)
MKALIVHGGCGPRPATENPDRDRALKAAVAAGLKARHALDMAERAARVLEDCPLFNAGTGSVLTLDGGCEMDAALMTSDGRAGAVGGISSVRNPVSVARRILEDTDHHLLVGEGATRFARLAGFPRFDPRTPERVRRWRDAVTRMKDGATEGRFWKRMTGWAERYLPKDERGRRSTIGAVAIDARGGLAVATSTGGIWFKLPGRVGDTPILGGGTYACAAGAVSATGHGEGIMRTGLARRACELMQTLPASSALAKAIEEAQRAGIEAGLIGIDRRGRIAEATSAAWMPTATGRGR